MSGFGGAVKLTGESEYKKALSQINQSLKETASEMKVVSSAFDKNDKSEQAVTAQTEVLNKKLTEQNQKLQTLKQQYSAMSGQYSEQTAKHNQLVKTYQDEKSKLEEIGRTLGTSSKEYQQQKSKVESLAQEVDKSTKAQDANEKSMSQMRIEINKAQADCNATAKELNNLGKEADEAGSSAEKAGGGFTVFKAVLANLATSVIQSAISGLQNLGGELINVGKQAIEGFGEFEQLEGGVKKLFGDDVASSVMQNAQNAFSSAGMSANEYMNTVTSFSASLISGLNGDTAKASKIADQAIRDMSDNANTFGTDISSIQNAYQGFAKGNFNMLDNLKLGYGGTKEEMLRLVKEAGVVDESVKSIDDVSFDQIIEGIHIVQDRMNIAGTTAKEASATIQGSVGSMKSAWQNMLTGMADENANFEQLATNLVNTLITQDGQGGVLGTLVPRISQVVTGMANALQTTLPMLIKQVVPIIQQNLPIIISAVQQALQTVLEVLPDVIPVIADLIPQIASALIALSPELVNTGMQMLLSLINGITTAIPQLIGMLPDIINQMVTTLLANLPIVIDAGMQLLLAIVNGLMEAIPQLIDYLPTIIDTMVNVLLQNLPKILDSAIKIMTALIQGLTNSIPKLVAMIPTIIKTIVRVITQGLPQILSAGVKIITQLISGIGSMFGKLGSKAGEILTTITGKLKEIPSKMLDIGKNLVHGLWNGISNGLGWIKEKLTGWIGNVTGFIKKLFGIKSPSKLFRDEIGKNLALGIGVGFEDEMKHVSQQMGDAIPQSFDIQTVNGARYTNSMENVDVVASFKQALSEMKIILDDEVAGQFVETTVSRAIYT